MNVKLDIELEPFRIPNYVLVRRKLTKHNEGAAVREGDSYHISELPIEVLEKLCDEFKANVLKKKMSSNEVTT